MAEETQSRPSLYCDEDILSILSREALWHYVMIPAGIDDMEQTLLGLAGLKDERNF